MSDVLIPTWTLGDRLAKAREVAGIDTAVEMAKRLGVSEKTIYNWEHEVTTPKLQTLVAWASVTHVPLWWLLGDNLPEGAAIHREWTRQPYTTDPPILGLAA